MDKIRRMEMLREKMITLGMKKGLNDPQVLRISRKIDQLIVKYYRSKDG